MDAVTIDRRDLIVASVLVENQADQFAETAKGSARVGRPDSARKMTAYCLEYRGLAVRLRRALREARH